MSDLISREAAAAREVFAVSCSAAKEAIDYLEQLLLRALPPTQEAAPAGGIPLDPATVADLAEDGIWRTCPGCYETEDGRPVGEYPYSHVMRCPLGSGCRECGGLGAYWDATDYAQMAAEMQLEDQGEAMPPSLPRESADMPYRIFTDTSRVWLDDDDGGSLFAYVREGAAPAVDMGNPMSGYPVAQEPVDDSVPERIFMPSGWEVLDGTIPVDARAEADDIEYIRADLARPSTPASTQAAQDALAERQRQIDAEGFTTEQDDAYQAGDLADAAACYALHKPDQVEASRLAWWPWAASWWKPKDRRRNLVKAAALILAEIERLDRAALTPAPAAPDPEADRVSGEAFSITTEAEAEAFAKIMEQHG